MVPLLEVIAQTVEDARAAQAGGANRLEVVSALECGGLTPSLSLLESVLAAVTIPVRVMLREQASMSAGGAADRSVLFQKAASIGDLPVDGVVAGFLTGGTIDHQLMLQLAAAMPGKPMTFHRAFDVLSDPLQAIEQIRSLPAVDRILTAAQGTSVEERAASVLSWQGRMGPSPVLLFAPGLAGAGENTAWCHGLREVHVGRAVRNPATNYGRVESSLVARLRNRLSQTLANTVA